MCQQKPSSKGADDLQQAGIHLGHKCGTRGNVNLQSTEVVAVHDLHGFWSSGLL